MPIALPGVRYWSDENKPSWTIIMTSLFFPLLVKGTLLNLLNFGAVYHPALLDRHPVSPFLDRRWPGHFSSHVLQQSNITAPRLWNDLPPELRTISLPPPPPLLITKHLHPSPPGLPRKIEMPSLQTLLP